MKVLAKDSYTLGQIDAWVSRLDTERFEHKLIEMPFFVACDSTRRIVGFSALNRATREVEYVYVDPRQCRKGIGSALVEAVLVEAARLGFQSVFLIASLNATAFYEATGFKPERTLTRKIDGEELRCVRMTRDVTILPHRHSI